MRKKCPIGPSLTYEPAHKARADALLIPTPARDSLLLTCLDKAVAELTTRLGCRYGRLVLWAAKK